MALPKLPNETQLITAIQELERRLNNKGSVTLKAGSPETIVSDPRVYNDTVVFLSPKNIDASSSLHSGTYVSSVSKGSFTITHAESPNTNRTFAYLLML